MKNENVPVVETQVPTGLWREDANSTPKDEHTMVVCGSMNALVDPEDIRRATAIEAANKAFHENSYPNSIAELKACGLKELGDCDFVELRVKEKYGALERDPGFASIVANRKRPLSFFKPGLIWLAISALGYLALSWYRSWLIEEIVAMVASAIFVFAIICLLRFGHNCDFNSEEWDIETDAFRAQISNRHIPINVVELATDIRTRLGPNSSVAINFIYFSQSSPDTRKGKNRRNRYDLGGFLILQEGREKVLLAEW